MKHLNRFNEDYELHGGDGLDSEDSVIRKWEFRDLIEKCISENCKEIPWEGTEIDKSGIIDSIISALDEKYIVTKK